MNNKVEVTKVALGDILSLRALFLQESNFQVRYNACHERGWSDSYLFSLDGLPVGYASVKGLNNISDRDTVFECYILPPYRKQLPDLFSELLIISGVDHMECQTNEPSMHAMMNMFGKDIIAKAILFEDNHDAQLQMNKLVFRKRLAEDEIFVDGPEPEGDYVLVSGNKVVATGGYYTHYNFPYADIYMEVMEPERRKGYGSFIVQEIRRACYNAGRVPAARCNIENIASKGTLEKAGMRIAGYMLCGNTK